MKFPHFQIPDYINGGELFTHLYQREKFTENEVRIYIGEIVLALEHLHKVIFEKNMKYSVKIMIIFYKNLYFFFSHTEWHHLP